MWLILKLSTSPKSRQLQKWVTFFWEADNFTMSHIQTSHFRMSHMFWRSWQLPNESHLDESHPDESLPDELHVLENETHLEVTHLNATHFLNCQLLQNIWLDSFGSDLSWCDSSRSYQLLQKSWQLQKWVTLNESHLLEKLITSNWAIFKWVTSKRFTFRWVMCFGEIII